MGKRLQSWYTISFTGGLVTALYALLPPYIVYVDRIGLLPPVARLAAGTCMVALMGVFLFCRRTKQKPFQRKVKREYSSQDAFTLVELLIVISIIGILASLILPVLGSGRDAAYFARAKTELRNIATAVQIYSLYTDGFPADVSRGLPSGLEQYLGPGEWPAAPWPGSVYDWDNWAPGDLSHPPFEPVLQVSVRFCPLNQPSACLFPNEEWAEGFDYYSAFYYCIEGPCRSHSGQPLNHPGYCVNC